MYDLSNSFIRHRNVKVCAANCQNEQSRSACQGKNGLFIFAEHRDRNSAHLHMNARKRQREKSWHNTFALVLYSEKKDSSALM